ncbi:MAG: hypothetical protein BWZ01_02804 [Deltaproteobacteria bacterium ADurb.BinA179]|jgi:hypothetical protein|nr:MAG: hypothetical protein BWZ01_02804 [Deltaproteobacteria bacterium ADurb.BinA179]
MKGTAEQVFLSALAIMVCFAGNARAYEYQGIDIRGFISQGYLYSTHNNFFAETEDGTPQFNEAGINFSAEATDRLRLGIQFLARDLGSIGNNEVILDWAIADYRYRDWLGFTVGNMKFVHGLYNETRDLDMLRTFIFLPQSVYNEAWRESISSIQGAGIYGDIPLSDMGTLSYDLEYGTVNLASDKGAARLLEDQWPFRGMGLLADVDRIDVDYTYAASLKWITNLEGLILGGSTWKYRFDSEATTMLDTAVVTDEVLLAINDPALSGLAGPLSEYGTRITLSPTEIGVETVSYTASLEFTWRNLVFAAEYMRTTYNIEFRNTPLFTTLEPVISAGGVTVGDDGTIEVERFSSMGYYTSIAYRFTPWFELGTYYSIYYPNEDDKDGEDRVARGLDAEDYRAWLKDIALTARFDVNEHWIAKLEAHKIDGAAILLGADNPRPDDVGEERYEEDWYLLAAKVTYSF